MADQCRIIRYLPPAFSSLSKKMYVVYSFEKQSYREKGVTEVFHLLVYSPEELEKPGMD